jgi:hypothetical protein
MNIRRPAHATIVAYLALFAALGGSAYAVFKVGTEDLKRGAVTSKKIRDHTIIGRDLKPIVVRQEKRQVAQGNTGLSTAVARCHRAEDLVSGAGGWIGDGNVTSAVASMSSGLYAVRGTNPDGSADTLLAQAICVRH